MTHLSSGLFTGTTIQDQIKREQEDKQIGVRIYRRLVKECTDRGNASALSPCSRMIVHWFDSILECVRFEMRECNKGNIKFGRAEYARIFEFISAERVVACTLQTIMNSTMIEPDGISRRVLAYRIGNALLAECNYDTLKKLSKKENAELRSLIAELGQAERYEAKKRHATTLDKLQQVIRNLNPGEVNRWVKQHHGESAYWSRKTALRIGTTLLHYVLRECSATDYTMFAPAFEKFSETETEWVNGSPKYKTIVYVRPTAALIEAIEDAHDIRQWMRPATRPMIFTPASWETGKGGWYKTRKDLVTKATPFQRELFDSAQMPKVYEAVDALNATPMRISSFMYDVQDQIYQAGGGHAGIPLADDMPLPEREGLEGDALKEHKAKRYAVRMKNREVKGQRRQFVKMQSAARELLHRDAFWCPHMLDTRGRVYSMVQRLNHQESDTARSMFTFAEGLPVDDQARNHIKTHLAGMIGYDKVSITDRIRYIDQNIDTFQGWAEDPLANTGWMLEFDGSINKKKALQTLAAARALFDDDLAQRLPIQIDGSCNGLQHYAAMSRDPATAKLVNLNQSDPFNAPERIYTDVAEATRPIVEQDARLGNPVAQQLLEVVDISDRLAKQPTMTKVYGVTEVGAREQVFKQFKDNDQMTQIERYQLAMYASKAVLQALEGVCPLACEYMAVMQSWARKLTYGKFATPVRWLTPLGMPVVQEYYRLDDGQVTTIAGKLKLYKRRKKNGNPVPATGKQVDGIAPNFVHSIDSTHLMMVARRCQAEGIRLMTVHDSFWTHAANVGRLHQITRETFAKLHSVPRVHELHEQLSKQRPDLKLKAPPEPGSFDVNEVLGATYAFI